jgi:hypothetical protein
MMGNLWQDLRYAVRVLARNRGDTLAIAGLLALGLGAVTVTFSLFDAILLRPLPVRRPEELVRIVQHLPKLGVQASFPYSYYQPYTITLRPSRLASPRRGNTTISL